MGWFSAIDLTEEQHSEVAAKFAINTIRGVHYLRRQGFGIPVIDVLMEKYGW
jgi:hypothetical protein